MKKKFSPTANAIDHPIFSLETLLTRKFRFRKLDLLRHSIGGQNKITPPSGGVNGRCECFLSPGCQDLFLLLLQARHGLQHLGHSVALSGIRHRLRSLNHLNGRSLKRHHAHGDALPALRKRFITRLIRKE